MSIEEKMTSINQEHWIRETAVLSVANPPDCTCADAYCDLCDLQDRTDHQQQLG